MNDDRPRSDQTTQGHTPGQWYESPDQTQPVPQSPVTKPVEHVAPAGSVAPAVAPPRWSGKKTAVVAAMALGIGGIGAGAVAAATPALNAQSQQDGRGPGGFGHGGRGGPGGFGPGGQGGPGQQGQLPGGVPQQGQQGQDPSLAVR